MCYICFNSLLIASNLTKETIAEIGAPKQDQGRRQLLARAGNRKLVFLTTCIAVASVGLCQTTPSKKELKPFKPPEFRAIDPLIAKDEGCAKDLAKVPQMEGLEQRKFLADLFTFGCVRLGRGPYLVNILDLRQFDEGTKKVQVSHVKLLSTSLSLADAKNQIIDGWILFDNLISTELIEKVIAGLGAQKKE